MNVVGRQQNSQMYLSCSAELPTPAGWPGCLPVGWGGRAPSVSAIPLIRQVSAGTSEWARGRDGRPRARCWLRYSEPVPKPSGASERKDRRLAHALAALSRDIRRELQRELGGLGLDVREWTTLSFIEQRPYSSNAELSRRIGVTPQGVHTVILRLERAGLISRHPDPKHGRIARFILTERGQKMLTDRKHDV